MDKIIQSFAIMRNTFQEERSNKRVIMGFLLGTALFGYWLNLFIQYVRDTGEPVNILEAFIAIAHHNKNMLFLIVGWILIISDAPFVKGNTYLLLCRSSRKQWSMEDIIRVENVTKKFGTDTALENISVNFKKGKIYGIIGRNGSGKTVLFKTIIGFLKPTSGRVLIEGKEIGKETDFAENIGMIIETPGFLNGFSGYKNLEYLASIRRIIGKKEIRDSMVRVGLEPDNKKKVGKYSLGMRQRLGIAQAIMENPAILILDEPMNGLDKQGVEDVREILLRLKEEGKTIILASHNKEDIEILCDEVFEMDRGKLITSTR